MTNASDTLTKQNVVKRLLLSAQDEFWRQPTTTIFTVIGALVSSGALKVSSILSGNAPEIQSVATQSRYSLSARAICVTLAFGVAIVLVAVYIIRIHIRRSLIGAYFSSIILASFCSAAIVFVGYQANAYQVSDSSLVGLIRWAYWSVVVSFLMVLSPSNKTSLNVSLQEILNPAVKKQSQEDNGQVDALGLAFVIVAGGWLVAVDKIQAMALSAFIDKLPTIPSIP